MCVRCLVSNADCGVARIKATDFTDVMHVIFRTIVENFVGRNINPRCPQDMLKRAVVSCIESARAKLSQSCV